MFEKIVEATPAFDKRHVDPKKNYGIHGVELKFLLKGPKGVVQFLIYTNWHLPHVQEELINKCNPCTTYGYRHCWLAPLAADVGYHSYEPMYEGQTPITDSCPYLDGKPCYYDSSGLEAERVFKEVFVAGGHESLWKYLEEYYAQRFRHRGRNGNRQCLRKSRKHRLRCR